MALRDQPYLPLYVQDYLTDEKLNMCSASSQGVYVKLMCIMHKSEVYGKILFKQKYKQTGSMIENFALQIARQITFDVKTIHDALVELIEEGVLILNGEEIYQKRMVRDFEVSEQRSLAAKKGGGNPILFKQKDKQGFKQIDKQNTEYEYIYENEIEIDKEKEGTGRKNKFIPPTLDQVIDYCNERQNDVNPVTWINFYQAKNWMIGKNKMTDWKAAVRTWENKNLNISVNGKQPVINQQSHSGVSPEYKADILRRLLSD